MSSRGRPRLKRSVETFSSGDMGRQLFTSRFRSLLRSLLFPAPLSHWQSLNNFELDNSSHSLDRTMHRRRAHRSTQPYCVCTPNKGIRSQHASDLKTEHDPREINTKYSVTTSVEEHPIPNDNLISQSSNSALVITVADAAESLWTDAVSTWVQCNGLLVNTCTITCTCNLERNIGVSI